MKTVLYMAVSADGYIADQNGQTPWSDEEWEAFQQFVKTCDICLMGRKTYEIMRKDGFINGPKYIVVTNDSELDTNDYQKLAINSATDMPRGSKVGIIGGGELNGSLAKLGIIDEIILDIEPLVLGQGVRLFGNHDVNLKLKLLSSKRIGLSTIQNNYEVLQ